MDQYDTYGVEELRDGFFDASFFRPFGNVKSDAAQASAHSQQYGRQSPPKFVSNMIIGVGDFFWAVFNTHKGIKLCKASLAYMVCFILCLIPSSQKWLGPYNYWATIAVLLNHPARTVGAQLDGTVLCILGSAVGLGWGSLALKIADTIGRREGFVQLAIVLFAMIIAWLRATTLRLYQALMCAGLAAFFLCHIVPFEPHWDSSIIRDFALPWLVGMAVCQIVNVILLPRGGGRDIAYVFQSSIF